MGSFLLLLLPIWLHSKLFPLDQIYFRTDGNFTKEAN